MVGFLGFGGVLYGICVLVSVFVKFVILGVIILSCVCWVDVVGWLLSWFLLAILSLKIHGGCALHRWVSTGNSLIRATGLLLVKFASRYWGMILRN